MVTLPVQPTRYEHIARGHSRARGDLADRFAAASLAARTTVPAASEHEVAIRDVAAGVAAPTLIGFVLWVLRQAQQRRLQRLRFLSRDGQILYELAKRLAPHRDIDIDLEYVYSSRLTWSLAATDPARLPNTAWLFGSFIKPNAADLCARLGIPFEAHLTSLEHAGVSLDPDRRADNPTQRDAFGRFLDTDDVKKAAAERITSTRQLLLDYAGEHQLAQPTTGLVDTGWTGRMIGALVTTCEAAGMARPHALLWGHEPRPDGWTDPDRVTAYMYNTTTSIGTTLRVPDAPFLVESFCVGDHGIVTGYRRTPTAHVEPVCAGPTNPAAEHWGLHRYRSTIYACCDQLAGDLSGDVRQLVFDVMDAFWCHPTPAEARAWGSYPYDSDPAGTAVRPLARPLRAGEDRADRAWLAGSVALCSSADD
jgi:hypothetical protein